MVVFEKIELGQDALIYIKDELQTGDTYAKQLAKLVYEGKIYTFLPHKFKNDPINFRKSIYLTTKIRIYDETRDIASKFIASFLDKENRVSLMETLSSRESIKKKPEPPSTIYYHDEVYFTSSYGETINKISRAFKGARDYPFVCGLIDLSGANFTLSGHENIQPEWWITLAQNTQYVIIGAFDSEGFLILEKYNS